MNRQIVVTPRAQQDVIEILKLLENRQAVQKFQKHYTKQLLQISRMPYLYARIWRNVRCVPVKGFEYVVFYVVRRRAIEVIAVVHGAREASAWKSRL